MRLRSFPTPIAFIPINSSEYEGVLINPLYNEFPIDAITSIIRRVKISSIDIQGFLRIRLSDGTAKFKESLEPRLRKMLSMAKIVKVGEDEFFFKEPVGEIFIVTRGAKGCSLYLDGEWINIPSHKVDKVAVGVGDMFISHFTRCFMDIREPVECAVRSNALVSAILELSEFKGIGCFKADYLERIRDTVETLWKERIEEIKTNL